MTRETLRVAVPVLAAALALPLGARELPLSAFRFFAPAVQLTSAEAGLLQDGRPLVRMVDADDGEIAVFAAVRTSADGPRLLQWVREIAALKKSDAVTAIARFSTPPRLDDLRTLELDDEDLEAARDCRPGGCDLKLTSDEMASLRQIAAEAGEQWREAVQTAFRQIALTRVREYLTSGHDAVGPYADRSRPVSLSEAFGGILGNSTFLQEHVPELAAFLRHYPDAPGTRPESLVYWSKERLGGRPTISATHVAMLEPDADGLPEAIVAGKQIFATHYTDGSLSVTTILRGASPGEHYLAYLNRSRVDVLERWYGGLVRGAIERRLRGDAGDILDGLRQRLESGPPE